MEASQEPVVVDAFDVGLDRAKINETGQIQLPEPHDVQQQDIEDRIQPHSSRSSTHNVVDTLKTKKHKAGIKIRKTLHIGRASDDLDLSMSALAGHEEEPSKSRFESDAPEADKATMKDFIHNPLDTVRAKVSEQSNHQVASKLQAKEVPHGNEVDLINASEAVEHAESDAQRLLAIQDLSRLMTARQATYARWTLDRHVTKVRLVPRDQIRLQPRSAFERYNPQEGKVIDWKAYAQHVRQGTLSRDLVMP